MNNKFKIVIPSYNNEKWVDINVESILEQTYDNYEVLYIDDCSTDNTRKLVDSMVANNSKWKVITNKKNMRRGYNIDKKYRTLFDDENEILVFIDGDDWLPTPDVLSNLNSFYNKHECWMTYGESMVCWKGGEDVHEPNPQNSLYTDDVHNNKNYRKDWWRLSHLRTFKWFLYNKIKDEDLRYSKTNEYYFHVRRFRLHHTLVWKCVQKIK